MDSARQLNRGLADPRADEDRFYAVDAKADQDELDRLIAKHDGDIMSAFRAIMAMPQDKADRLLALAED